MIMAFPSNGQSGLAPFCLPYFMQISFGGVFSPPTPFFLITPGQPSGIGGIVARDQDGDFACQGIHAPPGGDGKEGMDGECGKRGQEDPHLQKVLGRQGAPFKSPGHSKNGHLRRSINRITTEQQNDRMTE